MTQQPLPLPGLPLPDLLVLGAARLATPLGASALSGHAAGRLLELEQPALAVRDGRIAWVGVQRDLPEGWLASSVPRLDVAGATLLPGFVDPHTHAVFAGWREEEFGLRLQGVSYSEIAARGGGIVRTMEATRCASLDELTRDLESRLQRMLLQGVTTAEVKSGYGLDAATELRQLRAIRQAASPVRRVATFLGAHAVPPDMRDRREAYVASVIALVSQVAGEDLADACDVFCDEGAFTIAEGRAVLQAARSHGMLLKVHADELTACGGAELAAEVGAVSAEHLLHCSDGGMEAMAAAGVVAVLLPATAFLLREQPVRAERFRAAGCALAVGTDFNPGSSPCDALTLAASIGCVASGLSPDEALTAITLNAAAAVGLAGETGSLEIGKRADVAVLGAPSHRHLTYRFGANLITGVIAGGEIVVRDGRLV